MSPWATSLVASRPQRWATVGLVSVALAIIGLLSCASSAGASTPTNSSIASIANSYADGSRVGDGQCWTFMHVVVLAASGGSMSIGRNGDYYGSYTAVGAQLISPDNSQPGDIIQKYNPSNPQDAAHVHTAIILNHSPGSQNFAVVDQNFHPLAVWHHNYNPWTGLAPGWAVAIWRVGTASGSGGGGSSPKASSIVNSSSWMNVFDNSGGNLRDSWWQAASGWHNQIIATGIVGSPSAIARTADSMDVFYQSSSGNLMDAWWNVSTGWHNQFLGAGDAGSPSAIANNPGWMNVFYLNTSGNLANAWWQVATGWHV